MTAFEAKIQPGDYLLDKHGKVFKIQLVSERKDGLTVQVVEQFVSYHYAHTVSSYKELVGYQWLGHIEPQMAQLLYKR